MTTDGTGPQDGPGAAGGYPFAGNTSPTGTYGYGQPAMPPASVYAHWGRRVGSALLDGIIQALPVMVCSQVVSNFMSHDVSTYDASTGFTTTSSEPTGPGWALFALGALLSLAVFIWNVGFKQGRTGQSIGKKAIGTRLVSTHTGQPIGVGASIVREIAHVLDTLPCDIGYLWPLWDPKRQTFADKVMKTVVVRDPQA